MRPLILVFLHGTILMHATAVGKSRKEIITQVRTSDPSVRDYERYVPIGNAAVKLQRWAKQGATIAYLSSLTESKRTRGDEVVGKEGLEADARVLERFHFPAGTVYHRELGETYADVVHRMRPAPDILIEDDCESIGGKQETTTSQLNPQLQSKIRSIIIPEFGGIDHLPDNPAQLVF
jgi:hypothetical protein